MATRSYDDTLIVARTLETRAQPSRCRRADAWSNRPATLLSDRQTASRASRVCGGGGTWFQVACDTVVARTERTVKVAPPAVEADNTSQQVPDSFSAPLAPICLVEEVPT